MLEVVSWESPSTSRFSEVKTQITQGVFCEERLEVVGAVQPAEEVQVLQGEVVVGVSPSSWPEYQALMGRRGGGLRHLIRF